MSNFFSGEFFDGCFFGPCGGAVPAGVRKRRILPDGRRIYATEQEAIDILLLYYHDQKLKPKEAEVLGLPPNRKKKVIILPSEHQDISEALETIKHEALIREKRRQEEEWLILLH